MPKTNTQKEQDRKGKERIKKFEKKKTAETVEAAENEDTITAWQKKGKDDEWTLITVPFIHKKR